MVGNTEDPAPQMLILRDSWESEGQASSTLFSSAERFGSEAILECGARAVPRGWCWPKAEPSVCTSPVGNSQGRMREAPALAGLRAPPWWCPPPLPLCSALLLLGVRLSPAPPAQVQSQAGRAPLCFLRCPISPRPVLHPTPTQPSGLPPSAPRGSRLPSQHAAAISQAPAPSLHQLANSPWN